MSQQMTPPQPWDEADVSETAYIEWAKEQERSGQRLVVETIYTHRRDPRSGPWPPDYFVLSDVDTGEVLVSWPITQDEPESANRGLIVLRREIEVL